MSHERILPRDLFNEAKLLKCLGRLSLLKHEHPDLPFTVELDEEKATDRFIIEQDQDTGDLYVSNIRILSGKIELQANIPYNAPNDPWPLRVVYDDRDEFEETSVFDENGDLTAEARDKFREYAAKLA